jgi:hypothetical protein
MTVNNYKTQIKYLYLQSIKNLESDCMNRGMK